MHQRIALGQQLLEFAFAPAAVKRGAVQLRQRAPRRAARRLDRSAAPRPNIATDHAIMMWTAARRLRQQIAWRLGVGRAQIKRLWPARSPDWPRRRATPPSRCRAPAAHRPESAAAHRLASGRPACWRRCRPDAARRSARRASASSIGATRGFTSVRAVAAHHLEIDMIVPRIDGGRGSDARRSRRRTARRRPVSVVSPTAGFAGGERNAARGGDADAQAR